MAEKNLIKMIEKIKEKTNLDLSLGEDLSIALMNIISLEEHFLFSYMKTQDERFLEFLEQTRESRKRLLAKIVVKDNDDYSEKWCISKHLLSIAMRLSEVGTKLLHDGKKKEAEESFKDAFNFYSLFWIINGVGNSNKNKKINPDKFKISQLIKKMLDCCRE
ncbi:MAG: hypothetical protein Q8N99_01990 [Nanoarchaeota archaeon]|nr:hypothetical protein [Nanoarchaeota archaeon]